MVAQGVQYLTNHQTGVDVNSSNEVPPLTAGMGRSSFLETMFSWGEGLAEMLHIRVHVYNGYFSLPQPKQYSIWAPVEPQLGQVGPNWGPFGNAAWAGRPLDLPLSY